MSESKFWTQEQDNMVKALHEQANPPKWKVVAEIINKKFQIEKTAKKCQERYYNCLAPCISKHPWTEQEENKIIGMHNQIGNKWCDIAKQIAGRGHNCVKNKFYGIMRKNLRRINAQNLGLKKKKTINNDTMVKIISVGHRNSQENTNFNHLKQECLMVKNKIWSYGIKDDFEAHGNQIYREITKLGKKMRHYSIAKITGVGKGHKTAVKPSFSQKVQRQIKEENESSSLNGKENEQYFTKKEQKLSFQNKQELLGEVKNEEKSDQIKFEEEQKVKKVTDKSQNIAVQNKKEQFHESNSQKQIPVKHYNDFQQYQKYNEYQNYYERNCEFDQKYCQIFEKEKHLPQQPHDWRVSFSMREGQNNYFQWRESQYATTNQYYQYPYYYSYQNPVRCSPFPPAYPYHPSTGCYTNQMYQAHPVKQIIREEKQK